MLPFKQPADIQEHVAVAFPMLHAAMRRLGSRHPELPDWTDSVPTPESSAPRHLMTWTSFQGSFPPVFPAGHGIPDSFARDPLFDALDPYTI